MTIATDAICPCQLNPSITQTLRAPLLYSQCCEPLHNGERTAETAEMLMRSRYAAFVLVLPDYIVATTLPAQQALLDKAAIKDWAVTTDWAGLEIVQHLAKLGKRHAQVEFKAYFNSASGLQAHHELSTFVKARDTTKLKDDQTNWYFLDPTVAMNVTQKQPCLCGSGEKFKRCCGQYV